jgi:hypothetical protein
MQPYAAYESTAVPYERVTSGRCHQIISRGLQLHCWGGNEGRGRHGGPTPPPIDMNVCWRRRGAVAT